MTEETNCYECDTPLTTICPQCNALSAAPSADPSEDEVERVAEALRLAAIAWSGKPHPKEPYWRFLASAIAAMRPTLSEEDREEIAGLALSVKCLLEFEDFSDDRGERWKAYRVNAKTRAQTVLSLIGKLTGEGITGWVKKEPPKSLEPLRGKNLACWCPIGEPCHADVLLEIANQEPTDER